MTHSKPGSATLDRAGEAPAAGRVAASNGDAMRQQLTATSSPAAHGTRVVVLPERWPAELAVALLTCVTAGTFWRVFRDWNWLTPMVAAALASHLVAWGCRRLRLPTFVAAAVSTVGVIVFAGLVWYRKTLRYGIPTVGTLRSMRIDLTASWHEFATAIAPVSGRAGFLVAAAIGMWLIAFLADSLAFRAMAGVEAVLPASLGFALASAVGASRMRIAATALWLLAAFVVVAVLRALRASTTGTWLSGRARSIPNAMQWTLIAGVGATAIGVFGGANLPGVGSRALINTRNGVEGTRITVSPLVDIKGRLSRRSSIEAFKVRAASPAYWRLTVLDSFDGRRWQSNQSNYEKVSSALTSDQPSLSQTTLEQDITVSGLDGDFVPAAFTPSKISSKRAVRWEPDLQSLITAKGKLRAGDHFVITSQVPDAQLTADTLRQAQGTIPASISERYLGLPGDLTRRLRRVISQAGVQSSMTSYDKMRTLQDWFRNNFTYSLDVPAGNGIDAIDTFLNAKQGYCEQFAGTFAAMARALGIPSRVAVGFTQGTKQSDGSFVVLGKHAHAWPEVYLAGAGWVSFEPTPGRGNPEAVAITGVPAQQVDEGPAPSPSAQPAVTTTIGAGALSPSNVPLPDIPDPGGDFGGGTPLGKKGGGVPTWVSWGGGTVGGLGALGASWIGGIALIGRRRWRRREERAESGADKVVLAWHQVVDALDRTGHPAEPSETAKELAYRLRDLPGVPNRDLRRLADLSTIAGFAGIELDDHLVTEATTLRNELVDAAYHAVDRATRWRIRLDPRRVWRRLPGDRHRAEHARVTVGA